MKITIASGKGGTGKTTLSVNLASYIVENSPKDKNLLCLVDLDVEEPNAALFLSGKQIKAFKQYRPVPKWDAQKCLLCGKCQDVCKFNAIIQLPVLVLVYPELCHSCFACSELCPEQALPMVDTEIGQLRNSLISLDLKNELSYPFVEGILKIGEPSAVPLIQKTKAFVEENYSDTKIKIYDCPPGTSCPVIEAVKESDFTILVTEPTPFGLYDLNLAVLTMRQLKRKFAVVINRAEKNNMKVQEYCESEGIEILAEIPNDPEIASSYARGDLIYRDFPLVRKELYRLYNGILRIIGDDGVLH